MLREQEISLRPNITKSYNDTSLRLTTTESYHDTGWGWECRCAYSTYQRKKIQYVHIRKPEADYVIKKRFVNTCCANRRQTGGRLSQNPMAQPEAENLKLTTLPDRYKMKPPYESTVRNRISQHSIQCNLNVRRIVRVEHQSLFPAHNIIVMKQCFLVHCLWCNMVRHL